MRGPFELRSKIVSHSRMTQVVDRDGRVQLETPETPQIRTSLRALVAYQNRVHEVAVEAGKAIHAIGTLLVKNPPDDDGRRAGEGAIELARDLGAALRGEDRKGG